MPPTDSSSDPSAPTPGSPRARRALIIDDEPSVRLALRRVFTRAGWEVDEASDGREGLDLALASGHGEAPAYALIISDLRMPGFTGIDLHDALVERRPALLARLVFTTGDVASADAAAFFAAARCEVLQKPFELAAVRALMERAVRDLEHGAGGDVNGSFAG